MLLTLPSKGPRLQRKRDKRSRDSKAVEEARLSKERELARLLEHLSECCVPLADVDRCFVFPVFDAWGDRGIEGFHLHFFVEYIEATQHLIVCQLKFDIEGVSVHVKLPFRVCCEMRDENADFYNKNTTQCKVVAILPDKNHKNMLVKYLDDDVWDLFLSTVDTALSFEFADHD